MNRIKELIKKINHVFGDGESFQVDGGGVPLIDEPVCFETKEYEPHSKRITYFYLSTNNCSSNNDVYECILNDDLTTLSHMSVRDYWEGNEEKQDRFIISSIKGDNQLKNTIDSLLHVNNVYEWNGFSGKNPPNVLDGSSMKFMAKLGDESIISASGSDNFPKGYASLCKALYTLVNKGKLESVEFELQNCRFRLPDNWPGDVSVTYAEFGCCFDLNVDNKEESFARFNYSLHGYEPEENAMRLGRIVGKEYEAFLSITRFDKRFPETVSENQKQILSECESRKVFELIQESLTGTDGFEFVKEDGKKLYYGDARNIFTKAISFWLGLFLGGEYACGCKVYEVDGKKFKSVSENYERQKYCSPEQLKSKMYELFTEELADELVDGKLSRGELLVYDNELYVDYKKKDNPYMYGGYSLEEDIEQPDMDHAVIHVSVLKANEKDEKYRYSDRERVDFEMVRNQNETFVFSTFPYWDR